MAPRISPIWIAVFTGIANFGASALAVLEVGPSDVCTHENAKPTPSSTMGNLLMKCEDCGAEFDPKELNNG